MYPFWIVVIIVAFYLVSSIKILTEYEQGRHLPPRPLLPQAKGPGVILVFKPIDRIVRVSLRIDALEVPSQDVITRDNVTVKVNAVIFFRVIDPRLAVVEVSKFLYATSQLAQTTLRSVLGEVELDELSASGKSSTYDCSRCSTSIRLLGSEGHDGRGEAGGLGRIDDPGDRAPGRSRTRAPCQNHQRGRRI